LPFFPGIAPGQDAACTSCHGDISKNMAASIHNDLGCGACHENHEKYPHPKSAVKPECATCHDKVAADYSTSVHGRAVRAGNAAAATCDSCHGSAHETLKTTSVEYRRTVPDNCGMCHSEVADKFKVSVHGKAVLAGVPQAPICNDCHGEHSIQSPHSSASPASSTHIRETCAQCHADVRLANRFGLPADRVTSFDTSFHGLAAQTGSQTVANCASCHGFHDILPSSDEKSSVHAKNLPATCGKCHPGAGTRFAIGTIHWNEGENAPKPVAYTRAIYISIITGTLGLMLLHNLADYMRKVFRLRLKPDPAAVAAMATLPAREHRMYKLERIQHALLVISFFALVWTGFALKYPNELWSRPLLHWEASNSLRGWLHRVAGAVMIAVSLVHVITLIASRKLRHHWTEMFPRVADIRESLYNFLWLFGLRDRKLVLSSHSYIEKAEYWAVVWGTFIMALTGVALWMNQWMLQYFPKIVLDVFTTIHFYEAVLATAAIVVWHFYFIMFDPEVYPMDPAWLTGYSVRRRHQHHHAPAVAGGPGPEQEKDASMPE
jgi:cytochrome b subunit of formate dehydrogenase